MDDSKKFTTLGSFYRRPDGIFVWLAPILGINAIGETVEECDADFKRQYVDLIANWNLFGRHLKN